MKKKQHTSQNNGTSAAELDAMHESGVDLSTHMDLGKATRPGRGVQRITVDFTIATLNKTKNH